VFVAYLAAGISMGTFYGRVPAVREDLGLSAAALGAFLLMWALGSVCALPLSGAITTRLGADRTVGLFATIVAIGYMTVAFASSTGLAPIAFVGLWLAGAGTGAWDAAATVEGAVVEHKLGRAVMSRFRSGESAGQVIGAALGALAAGLHLPLEQHFGIASIVFVAMAVIAARRFIPVIGPRDFPDDLAEAGRRAAEPPPLQVGEGSDHVYGLPGADMMDIPDQVSAVSVARRNSILDAWKEPRILLLGVIIFSAAMADGSASDWTSTALVHGLDAPEFVGSLGVSVFFMAAFIMRLLGTVLVERVGRVTALRICSGLTFVGVALFAFAPWLGAALAGSLIWGAASALGFPLALSAAADDPAKAPQRVAVVSTIGYFAFLVAPFIIGQLAAHLNGVGGYGTGYRPALAIVMIPAVFALFAARAASPQEGKTTASAQARTTNRLGWRSA
jgi:MFS family permease